MVTISHKPKHIYIFINKDSGQPRHEHHTCQRDQQIEYHETRIIKDASGRVKYTVRENGQQEVIKDSKGHIAGTTRTTKDRKYYYDSNGSSAGSETRW